MKIKNWLSTAFATFLMGTLAFAQAMPPGLGLSSAGVIAATGWTYNGTQALATLDAAVSQGQAVYFDGASRVQGISFNGTAIRVLGNVPVQPGSDQSISFGSGAVRWSNSYIFTMNTWDPIVYTDFVDDSATTGNRTVNASRGFNAFAAAATAITITNSKVTATSQIVATIMTNDATALLKNCVPAAGSFTCTLNAAATGTTKIAWTVNK